MVSASLDMTRRLGLKSVTEGVENRPDWELLVRLKCDIAQGFSLPNPCPMRRCVSGCRSGWCRISAKAYRFARLAVSTAVRALIMLGINTANKITPLSAVGANPRLNRFSCGKVRLMMPSVRLIISMVASAGSGICRPNRNRPVPPAISCS